ncbi:MAG: ferredoxin [Sedimentitalea sp.]
MEIFERITTQASAQGLMVMGALHPARANAKTLDHGTLVLLGVGAAFWPHFQTQSEAQDGAPDPIDRWSIRVVTDLAKQINATAHFPFGGPPYAPFIDWAQKSGRCFPSPTGMMVHDTVGLMISFRGALHLPDEHPIPVVNAPSPCETCTTKPCTATCPVGALGTVAPYDVPACHRFLKTPPGMDCMDHGCKVRRACPVSDGAGRKADQSAHHMRHFHRG